MTHKLIAPRFILTAFTLTTAAASMVVALAVGRSPASSQPAHAARSDATLLFERNEGQHPSGIRFTARGAGYRLAIREHAVALALATAGGPAQIAMTFEGARSGITPHGEAPAAARFNYFVGQDPRAWRTDVPAFERVRYPRVYEGIDLVFYGKGRQIEYDLVVAPGARPEAARLRFDGVQAVRVADDGSLSLALPNTELRYTKPIAYQETRAGRRMVDVSYRLDGDVVSFEAGDYDRSTELVIDPVLVFSTFLGGTNFDAVMGVAVDAAGATYVTGRTSSTDFPVSTNAPQPNSRGLEDAFVTKFSRDGAIVYSTYFGGTNGDVGIAIDVDAAGAAYILGGTGSTDLPVSSTAFQRQQGGSRDAFVAKLTPTGNRIAYATYLGGSDEEVGFSKGGIAVDRTGIATVVGSTESGDFPTTSGAFKRTHTDGALIAFATRLNATGSGLIFSTLLTGSGAIGEDQGAFGVALDAQGRAIVVGDVLGSMTGTKSVGPGGSRDAYALKLNSTGSAVVFCTRFGGSGAEEARGVTYDPNRDVAFIVGTTGSADFPATGIQGRKGVSDAFLITILADGSSGLYNALLGGSDSDGGTAIGSTGDTITLFGTTNSSDFPVVQPLQPYKGSYEAFVARLRGSVDILFSTTLGGSDQDMLESGVIDGAGAATLGGATHSADFPVANAAQPTHGGFDDGFVARTALVPRGTPGPHDVVVHVADAATLHGDWEKVADPAAASGARLHNPDLGRAKVTTPLASPADYFEFTVNGLDGGPYRLWLRGKADGDSYSNDSVWVQFERAQNAGSDADNEHDIFRIGTAEAMAVVVEDCTNCGLRGWGWQDAGYGQKLLGPWLYFNSAIPTTIRVQRREDGISIDQIVLAKYDNAEGPYGEAAPGYQKDDDTILPAQDPSGTNEGDLIIYPGSEGTVHGSWVQESDPFAAGARRIRNPDKGAAKLTTSLAAPTNYIDLGTFHLRPGVGYRLWIRGKADADFYGNDSAFVQFDNSVDASGAPIWRIGTASATTYVLEDCSGCGVQGWGWNDNGYGSGVLGPLVYFEDALGTMRIQTREDGLAIDQIVLSPVRFLNKAPGATKNDTTIVSR